MEVDARIRIESPYIFLVEIGTHEQAQDVDFAARHVHGKLPTRRLFELTCLVHLVLEKLCRNVVDNGEGPRYLSPQDWNRLRHVLCVQVTANNS